MEPNFLNLPGKLLDHMDVVYTLLLLFTRFAAFMVTVPGIGGGERGLLIRVPAALILALTCLTAGNYAAVPAGWGELIWGCTSEFVFGAIIGLIPALIVYGIQTAAQIASSSMGLGAGQMFDPSVGGAVADLARILGDLSVMVFLLINGHHIVVHAVSGMGGVIVPGSFHLSSFSVNLLVDRTALIFRLAVMVSAPVVVALLLTQFVMGLISRAVPTVNIFIVSFPLTIGIGLIVSILALKDITVFAMRQFADVQEVMLAFAQDGTTQSDANGGAQGTAAQKTAPPAGAVEPDAP